MTTTTDVPLRQRRREFVDHLEQLARDIASDNHHVARPARQILAQLRRSVTGQRHEHEALAILFMHRPPRDEENTWLLIAGLFALNPQTRTPRLRLGAALRRLDLQRPGTTASKRLRQLLAADLYTLPQHLRSTLQLLASHDIAIDFHTLLADAITVLRPEGDEESRRDIRWQWARDFHRQSNTNTNNNGDSQESPE